MKRMRAWNCITGSLVPVTWKDVRKAGQAADRRQILEGRNLRYAGACAARSRRRLLVDAAVERGVILKQVRDRLHAPHPSACISCRRT